MTVIFESAILEDIRCVFYAKKVTNFWWPWWARREDGGPATRPSTLMNHELKISFNFFLLVIE